MKRSEKINYLKENLFPLLSYIDPNTDVDESYQWSSGDRRYHISKCQIGGMTEVYARICENKKFYHTWMYQLPYQKGSVDFVDFEGWTCQVV